MSELSKKYSEIIKEVDQKITDEAELQFVKNKISEISIIFIDIIDRLSEILEERIIDIEQSQKDVEQKLSKVQTVIDSIEQDIYEENSDIEITCPYCNNEFMAEFNEDEEIEIECPECHNIIELDLNANIDEDSGYFGSGCQGGCGTCGGCGLKNNMDDYDEGDI